MLLTVPDFHRETKKTGMERSGPTTSACPAGAAQAEHLLLLRKATAAGLVLDTCTCWFVSVCLSPPTSGLAWRGRQRGAKLDGELLSTPLAADFGPGPEAAGRTAGRRYFFPLLSTPLAADFGPGPEASAEGRATGRGIRVPRLSSPTSGLARMGQRGARSWTRSLLFMPLAANFGPGRRLYGVS